MIEIKTTIFEQMEGLRKRGHARVMKRLFAEILRMWLNRFFDEHFKPSAYYRYGRTYKERRTKSTSERPLYDTGRMMLQLKLSAKITSTSKKGTLVMTGPWYTTAFRRALDKEMEITVVNRREGAQLARFAERRLPALMRRETGMRVVKIK